MTPPRPATAELTRPPDELKVTKAIDPSTTATVPLDLPLVDIPSVEAGFTKALENAAKVGYCKSQRQKVGSA